MTEYNQIKLSVSKDKQHVVTSHGYRVSLQDAIRLYRLALKQKHKNKAINLDHKNIKIGVHTIKSINRHGSVTIAMTTLKFPEMKRLYNRLIKQNIISEIK